MNVTDFLQAVSDIAAESPRYRTGGDGSDGTCDCIGLIIGAIRRCGAQWPGIHGSNWAARNICQLRPIDDMLQPGHLVFKFHQIGHDSWDLPARYATDPDQLDYYHVGVVTSIAPLRITHCTTPGIVIDKNVNAWDCAATLDLLSLPVLDAPTRIVYAPSGSTVNLRHAPMGSLLTRVPVGTEVQIQEESGDWAKLTYRGWTGWMLKEYLQAAPDQPDQPLTIEERLSKMESTMTELRKHIAQLEANR